MFFAKFYWYPVAFFIEIPFRKFGKFSKNGISWDTITLENCQKFKKSSIYKKLISFNLKWLQNAAFTKHLIIFAFNTLFHSYFIEKRIQKFSTPYQGSYYLFLRLPCSSTPSFSNQKHTTLTLPPQGQIYQHIKCLIDHFLFNYIFINFSHLFCNNAIKHKNKCVYN